jgi:ribosome-associated toxin RatA of RatAB toxin-antitoxin module
VFTEDHITIDAAPERIFALAARVEDWPEILPHYRWVTVLRDDGARRLVEMAATRDGIPVKWAAIQELEPVRQAIHFRHVRGVTRGMVVQWSIEPGAHGTNVGIAHRFDPNWPRPVGPLIARYVVGELFVHNVAGKTLRQIKRLAEANALGAEQQLQQARPALAAER